jgi:hypothetical protein
MEQLESYDEFFVISDSLKENVSKMSDCQINMMAEIIANSIRDSQAKIRAEFEKENECTE